ncbi:hypothetical protein BDW22DRAFT_1338568 [Trametopsis cervina]|nr:hypothetical protein BDW22DRAFT_1338568 [Trametopsis cervina]
MINVAEYLLDRGIPFKTVDYYGLYAQHLPPAPTPPLFREHVPLGLGVRLPRYNFSIYDFAAYEERRDKLVRSPRGRAAFLMGGIVWRLAMESMGYEDVLRGPSGFHTQADVITIDARAFVDDTLTEHELDIICGVYRTLGSEYYIVASDMSWWPKHQTWTTSGLDIGYWTDKDERWFQGRRNAIITKGEGPKDASKWAGSIKNKKGITKTLQRATQMLADKKIN